MKNIILSLVILTSFIACGGSEKSKADIENENQIKTCEHICSTPNSEGTIYGCHVTYEADGETYKGCEGGSIGSF
jgi:hypothetical protein